MHNETGPDSYKNMSGQVPGCGQIIDLICNCHYLTQNEHYTGDRVSSVPKGHRDGCFPGQVMPNVLFLRSICSSDPYPTVEIDTSSHLRLFVAVSCTLGRYTTTAFCPFNLFLKEIY